jgi:hypothetical protein
MLNTALTKLIDKTECLFFINTPHSITSENTIRDKTNSPWIYSELVISELIRKRKLADYRPSKDISKGVFNRRRSMSESRLNVDYDAYLGHLTSLEGKDIKTWLQNYSHPLERKSPYPLDELYAMFP